MSTIDLSTLSAAQLAAALKQAREREKTSNAPEKLGEMVEAAQTLRAVLTQFIDAASDAPFETARLQAMGVYQRDFFPALNAFQGLSSAATISIGYFYKEGMTDAERAEHDRKQAERAAKAAAKKAKAPSA